MTAVDDAVVALRRATLWRGRQLATLLWWRDAELLRLVGAGLASLFPEESPTLIVGVQSSGFLLAPLVATHLGVGMLGVQQVKDASGGPRFLIDDASVTAEDRVLLVDDVAETGGQIRQVRDLVTSFGATWLGSAVMVSYLDLEEPGIRSLIDIESLAGRIDPLRLRA